MGEVSQGNQEVTPKKKRKAIPPMTCDYVMRMQLKAIEATSRYMAGGCQAEGLGSSMFMCVELINLRNTIDKILKEYSI